MPRLELRFKQCSFCHITQTSRDRRVSDSSNVSLSQQAVLAAFLSELGWLGGLEMFSKSLPSVMGIRS
jgi:hypothetical protein